MKKLKDEYNLNPAESDAVWANYTQDNHTNLGSWVKAKTEQSCNTKKPASAAYKSTPGGS